MKKKLLYINNFEAPYRVPFFNYLGEKYDLTLLLSEKPSDRKERNKKWFVDHNRNYNLIYLDVKNILGIKISFDVKKYLCDYDIVFFDMYSNPTNIYAMYCLNKMQKKYVLSVDGMLAKSKELYLLRQFKKYLLSGPAAILSSGISVDDCLVNYGVNINKIFRYNFTSLLSSDINKNNIVSEDAKILLKNQLGMNEEKVIISVGRFTYNKGYGKGYDKLLKISKKISDVGIYIIGDEPTDEFVNWKNTEKLNNVHFVGFKCKSELAKYYQVADLFVLLTQGDVWGLVINEAMSYGLPIITTDRCVAGLELVKTNFNGYIVPADSIDIAYNAIKDVIYDDQKLKNYKKNSFKAIQNYTIEKMAEQHINVFEKIFM